MTDYRTEQSKISWTTVKIKTLVTWGVLFFLIVGGGGTFYYLKFVVGSPEKKAERAIQEARVELTKLENHEKSIPELTEGPTELLVAAEEDYKAARFDSSLKKAEQSLEESKTELERLIAAGEGHKSATFYSLEGTVQVRKKDRQEWIEAKERMPLYAGDYVKTGPGSGAVILFFDSSQYRIQENALILIERSYEDPATKRTEKAIKIDDGNIDVSTVKPNAPGSSTTVSTPSSKTIFKEKADSSIEYNKKEDETRISLFEGTANTRIGDQTVSLHEKEKIKIDAEMNISQKIKLLSSPVLVAPPHREIYEIDANKNPEDKILTFSWGNIDGAEEYLLEVSRNQMFLKPIRTWTRKNTRALKGFKHGTYYWRVSAARNKREDKSKPSDAVQFTLRQRIKETGIQKDPPKIEIFHAYPLGEYFLISGKTDPGVKLTVNNIEWNVGSDGTFKDLIALPKIGKNKVIFRAVDPVGNVTTKPIILELK